MKSLVAMLTLLLCGSWAAAACHAVGPSAIGSGSGADWNNMANKLPATVTRGDTYYLADGSYGAYTFNTAGTTATTIRKATATDQGQGCTPSIGAGWNTATMGSSNAKFTQWAEGTTSGGHYTLTGVFGGFNNTSLPTSGGFGIFLNSTGACPAGTLARCVPLDGNGSQNFASVTFSYIEIQGSGATSAANTNTPDDLVYYGGSSNLTLDHMYMHDSSCDFTFGYTSTNLLVQFSYFYKNWGAGSCHGQVSWNGSTHTNPVWRYNVFRTIEGTAVITAATAGGGTTLSGLTMYGNVFYWGGNADKTSYQCLGNGLISCVNSGVACTNVKFYNNTIVGFPADNSNGGPANCGASGAGFYDDGAATWSGLDDRDNIWYGNNTSSTAAAAITSVTEDYNSYLNNGPANGSGVHDLNNNSAANPFVLWAGSGNLNANLTGDSANVNNWLALASPFNSDPNGTTRTTDRGAFQFASLSAPVVSLSATSTDCGNSSVGVQVACSGINLTNTGNATLSISSIVVGGTNSADFSQANNCGASLGAGLACTITPSFNPTAGGVRSASIAITDNAADSPESISLSGTGGVPVTSLTPSSLTFGSLNVSSSSSPQTLTLSNTGTAALSIASISLTGTNTGDFFQLNNCPVGSSLGTGSSCTITVTFTPLAVGARAASVSVVDGASGSPHTSTLSGTGVQPAIAARINSGVRLSGRVVIK